MRRMLPAILLVLTAGASLPAAAQHALANHGDYDAAVPAPHTVLGHQVGERFTPHHLLMRYLERVAAASPRVRLDTVAHSFEGREVVMVIVTSRENMARLDQIRADAARIADPRGASGGDVQSAVRRLPAIAWMGYTVHGPEASGVEAAIAFTYQLAAGQDAQTRRILDSTVVLIDPVQNPDGHERHAQDVMRMRSSLGVPTNPAARIHSGTWPGPRTSHYHFDLNRDWYAQSHPETRGRTAAMLQWWPHVAVDLHEMGSSSSYFFPPPMDPVNMLVHPSIVRWWDVFAAGTIEAFDRNGWSFFRREGYDEFYPGYGSSWPLYAGAVGMTYEQASSRGGAIMRSDGTVLTLQEAARRHYTASWATVSTAAARRSDLVRDYAAYRQSAITDGARAPFRYVVLERDAQGRADSLARLLTGNGIEVQSLRGNGSARTAVRYGGGNSSNVRLAAGSYVVDFAQPQGRLARVLLEPEAPLDPNFVADELERRRTGRPDRFYDMTAWSLPFTFRVRAWGVNTAPGDLQPVTSGQLQPLAARDLQPLASGSSHAAAGSSHSAPASSHAVLAEARYGYVFAPGSESSLRLLAALLNDSVRVWLAPRSFSTGGHSFPNGAFLVRVAANNESVHERVSTHAAAAGAEITAISSAAVSGGTDLGSNSVMPLKRPRVALLAGSPISGQSFGYAWYAFDQRLRYPTTALDVSDGTGPALDEFDVLIIPSASSAGLARAMGDAGKERLGAWVRNGGTLITIDGATAWLASERSGLARLRTLTDTASRADTSGAPLPMNVPGAIVRTMVDTLSLLTAGIDEGELPVLYFSDAVYTAPRDFRPGEIVIRYAPENRLRISGYMWPEVPRRLAGTPYLWTERVGRGRVIGFAGDPNFRDLWRSLLPLFANAVFIGPNM